VDRQQSRSIFLIKSRKGQSTARSCQESVKKACGNRENSLTTPELVAGTGKRVNHGWGTGFELETHLLQVNISNLRGKIEPDPSRPVYIVTEVGVGY